MKVAYSLASQADLRGIRAHIQKDNPAAAGRVVARIRTLIREHLTVFPELGWPWMGGPTRALAVAGIPYRIHYKVDGDTLVILRIFHTSRLPPKFA